MITESEEIMGVHINYDAYVKRDMEQYSEWMPFTYEIAASVFGFLNENFFFEVNKPIIYVNISYDYASYNREIQLSVRIKDTGFGEAELFTMDMFDRTYAGTGGTRGFVKSFMERFHKNILRSAVMEKIELYRDPPKPIFDWFTIKMTSITLADTAITVSLAFVSTAVFIIYMCLK